MLGVMSLDEHSCHSARTKHSAGALHFLVACDETVLPELELALAALPLCARGRVFVEVPSEEDIGFLVVPPRMTVTWLTRSQRAGRPGTGEACQRGTAVARAACAWATEMLCAPDMPGAPDMLGAPEKRAAHQENTQVWLGGDYRGVASIHEHLTADLGLPSAAISTRAAYRLT